ncbi:MAG: bacillithiol system redox-active protein YtxJ [Flavobacteriales bacterium]|nr:bacillithiol system redox-active protein YtxJ [Flavobacteriales bacterium]
MNWTPLTELAHLDVIDAASKDRPVLIFKHSTRCSISSTALHRLEREWRTEDQAHAVWYLDLLRFRPVSNAIAERYGVRHESPQVLVVRDGRCVHSASHTAITYTGVVAALMG